MKNIRALTIAFILALVAMAMVFSYIKSREAGLVDMSTPVMVVVASGNIKEGSRLDEGNTILKEIPKRFVQPDSINDIDSLYDSVVTIPVLENTQILESMLATPEQSGLAQKIPKNKVGYTISVNSVTGVAGLLQPGDYVNVLLSVELGEYTEENGVENQETLTMMALENVLILAVDQKSRRTAINQNVRIAGQSPGSIFGQDGDKQSMRDDIKTVTLAVENEDCLKLTMAQELGSISLALHSSWSEGESWAHKRLDSSSFLGVEKPVVRKSLPAWVEIRGAEQMSRY